MSTIISLYVASIKEFVRDRATIFWTLAFPLIFIVLFGVIFNGGGAPNYKVGIVNEDSGTVGQTLIDSQKIDSSFSAAGASAQALRPPRGG